MILQKPLILETFISEIEKKEAELTDAIKSAKQSRDNETKSSVGDKYETSRTLIQYEVEKYRAQRSKIIKIKDEILKIDPNKNQSIVEFGSLVNCSNGIFLISVAWGKLKAGNTDVHCISLASPLGKELSGKKVGQTIQFNNTSIRIENIN